MPLNQPRRNSLQPYMAVWRGMLRVKHDWNNWWWIIILILLAGGFSNGCGCDNDCGCGPVNNNCGCGC